MPWNFVPQQELSGLAAGITPDALVVRLTKRHGGFENLVAKSKDGTISIEEQSELDDYPQLEHILMLAKARDPSAYTS